jgi:nucleotidyltransferase/DNA polymerase involved in DNA repair
MDAFYASVEQRDHLTHRGCPVIVGADPRGGRGRGVVSAASYEARAFGIHSAMPISQAYRRCPKGVFLPVRMSHYQAVSAQIFQIFGRYTDLVEPLSEDESFRTQTRSVSLSAPTDQSQDLYRMALMLLERLPTLGRKVRLLGVTASKLSDCAGSGQRLSLELDPSAAKQRRLTKAVDRIQARFGKKAIRPASLLTSS